jgi:hypothetical protein
MKDQSAPQPQARKPWAAPKTKRIVGGSAEAGGQSGTDGSASFS